MAAAAAVGEEFGVGAEVAEEVEEDPAVFGEKGGDGRNGGSNGGGGKKGGGEEARHTHTPYSFSSA